ncbi:MAG TPA: hypothetical protein VIH92_12240 [Solirubrobacteraceae bacterium]
MPLTVPPPQASPSSALEIDDGVIEEARRRRRRRHLTAIALGGAGAAALAASALLIGGGRGSGVEGRSSSAQPLKLTLVHGRAYIGGRQALMGVVPSLQAGNVGVCVKVVSDGGCNGPLPSVAYPVYGGPGGVDGEEKVGRAGEIDAIFVARGVAAMRVAHLGTFKAEAAPGLPPGARQIVFYRPPGSPGTVISPGTLSGALQSSELAKRGPDLTETLLNAEGQAIPVGISPVFTLPNSYWEGTQPSPADGRCAMSSSLAGVRTAWGQVATVIAPDPAITVPGWLTCLHTWYTLDGSSYETAILLNAKSPGSPPAMLWGAVPLAGHPGTVRIPAVEREIHFRLPQYPGRELISREVLTPPTVARRVGRAWVLVREGRSLAQRIALLDSLRVTRMEISQRQPRP